MILPRIRQPSNPPARGRPSARILTSHSNRAASCEWEEPPADGGVQRDKSLEVFDGGGEKKCGIEEL